VHFKSDYYRRSIALLVVGGEDTAYGATPGLVVTATRGNLECPFFDLIESFQAVSAMHIFTR
jgi:hypothetical protein